ncbi:hypothetical protein ACQPU1_13840 [Clostridium paraputrificum]|uniref:hypothetical protein n=1 Tax=Clostridium TaxID=1485 RepID=UPI003D32DB75
MQKKIETMVLGIGELSLDAISTWFPSKSKEIIMEEIEKSDVIGVRNNQVMAKARIKAKEKAEIVSKNINLAAPKEIVKTHDVGVENNVATIVNEDISYGELLELITKYNRRVKEKFEKLVASTFENKRQAIIKYYEKRFDVVKNPFQLGEGGEIYSLVHKKTRMEMSYLYIGEYLTEANFNKIADNFVEDTIYFCITRDSEVLPNISNREYYLKDVDTIVENYLSQYKLKEIDYTLLKIN